MLRAGLTRLKILAEHFTQFTEDKRGVSNKHPKMLILCEDTKVTPLVEKFLIDEGLGEDDVMRIDSNRKGEVSEEEWKEIKQRLFNVDKHERPKVIVSVLMLREGFDVNNICVIVPLRASASPILLEQTIGRGLRLMWREPQYSESKREARERLLVKKEEPGNWMDILSIIEHPEFIKYYDEQLSGVVGETKTLPQKGHIVGDLISIGLKEKYADYDF